MAKRKRSNTDDIDQRLAKARSDIYRTLRTVKGFERQRQSKRLRDAAQEPSGAAEKVARVEKDIAVLKDLDLEQTANSYLCSSLQRIKSIASHPLLPESIREGVPKPDLTEEERAALHRVTSSLFNRDQIRSVMDHIIEDVCGILGVAQPEKKRRKRKGANDDTETKDARNPPAKRIEEEEDEKDKEAALKILKESIKGSVETPDSDGADDDEEEAAIARFDALLGGSSSESDSDADDEDDDNARTSLKKPPTTKTKPPKTIRIRDMSISLSPSPSSSRSPSPSLSLSHSPSPPPKSSKPTKSQTRDPKPLSSRDSTFLPSLLGGYISGSESASDLDIAPRKNRLGQRQRQAIWEKKFGGSARHLNAKKTKGRDDGWDLRRGAVDPDDADSANKSRGKGMRNAEASNSRPKTKKDDEGVLHPSWEARKRLKEAQSITIVPKVNKIVFDG